MLPMCGCPGAVLGQAVHYCSMSQFAMGPAHSRQQGRPLARLGEFPFSWVQKRGLKS